LKIVFTRIAFKRILQFFQYALFTVAVGLLGYTAFALLDGWVFQNRQSRDLDERIRARQESPTIGAPSPAEVPAAPEDAPEPVALPAQGEAIGRIEIERIGLSVIVAEGVDKRTLRRAVGRIPFTALPGQPGNTGFAGHRDTFFRPLEKVVDGDVIVFTAPTGVRRYRVVFSRIVEPEDVWVLDPTERESMTLVTCYPFYFVGPAPQRFIVRAEKF
jgi:sortase A